MASHSHHRQSISCASAVPKDNGFPANSSFHLELGEVKRKTKETNVSVKINLESNGVADSSARISFLAHMLDGLKLPLMKHLYMFLWISTSLQLRYSNTENRNIRHSVGGALLPVTGEYFWYDTSHMIACWKNSHHIIEATFKAYARSLRKATESNQHRFGSIPRWHSLERQMCSSIKESGLAD